MKICIETHIFVFINNSGEIKGNLMVLLRNGIEVQKKADCILNLYALFYFVTYVNYL